jgi:hypothetical protein
MLGAVQLHPPPAQFTRSEVLLALLIGLVVAFATARPAALEQWPYRRFSRGWARVAMASLVAAAGGLVFLVLRQGLGRGTQLGSPDTQYVFFLVLLLGAFATVLHLEPLVRGVASAHAAHPFRARVAGLLAPFAFGGAIVLLAYAAGKDDRFYQHASEKLPYLPFVAGLIFIGWRLAKIYVAEVDGSPSQTPVGDAGGHKSPESATDEGPAPASDDPAPSA